MSERRPRSSRKSGVSTSVAMLALALLWANAGQVAADQDPRWRWRTIETDHFRIHYPNHLDQVARRMAEVAEGAHAELTEDLDWVPRRVTHLVVFDDTDYAQGVTYVGAQNVIRLWIAAPGDMSTLEDFDDWLTLLISHEYSHLVHIDQVRGLPTVINAIFGHIYHPNALLPLWLTEGYAVHEESSGTAGGRVRATQYDMYLRMAVLEDNFLRIDQATGGTRFFPQGDVAYLYGQDFVNYLVRRFGPDTLARLARETSDDVIPFTVSRSLRRQTGHDLVELWDDWRRSLEQGYRAVADRVRARGLTDSTQLTELGERMGPPRFDREGGQVYFYHTSEESPAAIWSVDVASGELHRLAVVPGEVQLAPSPDGRFLYLARGDAHDLIYRYNDIFRMDLRTGEEERLTDGARSFAADVSADGRRVAYAAYRGESSDLWIANAELLQRRRVLLSRSGEQVYTPRFSPDGRYVAISQWRTGGNRDIVLVDVESGSTRLITDDRALDMSPCFSPDGRYLVYSSDRTGIANLYAYDLQDERLWQVTNVISGAYMPDVSPDGATVAFVGYSSRGFDLHTMPFDSGRWREPAPAMSRRIEPSTDDAEPAEPLRLRQRRYSPWSTLAPRSWMFGVGQGYYGTALELMTYGEDASGAHRYAGSMSVSLERGDVSYDLSYEFARLMPNFTFRHARWTAPRDTLRLDSEARTFIEENFLVSADVSVWLDRGNYAHRLWAGYEFLYSRATTNLRAQEFDPSGRPPRFPELGIESGIRFGWTFSNARASVRAISSEWGRTITTSASVYHPALGSDWFQVTFRYRWNEFLLMPWRHHHVLALGLGGGISAGDLQTNIFYLGGYPEIELLTAVTQQAHIGGNYLRGYPVGVIGGFQYHLLNVEYRFPVWNPEVGIYTLPVYLSHIWMSLFCDAGGAFGRDLDFDELLVGIGGEVHLRFILGYQLPFTFRIGYAYGFMENGDHQVYAHLGVPF